MEDKDVILKVENISKQYRLGIAGTGTISHDLNRLWYKVRGKDDPYLKIGETNDRSTKGESDYVWAIKDISFNVKRGEVLGIIGKNGAGKSTLLKILSRVTGPTKGSIKTRGRIASLLEVGTGFHPEMTGRENIYLNGAILGMTKKEIDVKIDEIIEFSGCERYVDTPTKRYSSGMTVRLAFAVAAFLEPDILVVDEVLAVGDAEFQKKAIGKMQDISKSDGRTVLFVSHNMAAVRNLCKTGLVLNNGMVEYTGKANEAIEYYLSSNDVVTDNLLERKDRVGSGKIKVENISILNNKNTLIQEVISGDAIKIIFHLKKYEAIDLDKMFFGIGVNDNQETRVLSFFSDEMDSTFQFITNDKDPYIELTIPKFSLRAGIYDMSYQISENGTRQEDWVDVIVNAIKITVLPGDYYDTGITNRAGNYALIDGEFK